jgi:hypothetical protein
MANKDINMKNLMAVGIASLASVLSMSAQAEYPFTYINYATGTINYHSSSSTGTYSALSASLEIPMYPLPGIVSIEKIDRNGVDILKIGGGTYIDFGGYAQVYGLAHYNDYSDDADNDVSFTAGVHATFDERLNADLSFRSYTKQDSFNSAKLSVSYYVAPNVSFSAHYEAFENSDILSISANLSL